MIRTQQIAGRYYSEKEQAQFVQSNTELLNIFGSILSNNNKENTRKPKKNLNNEPPPQEV